MSILLCFFLSYLALAAATNYASESVVVVGKVFCDPCLEHRLSENGYVISGIISCHFIFVLFSIKVCALSSTVGIEEERPRNAYEHYRALMLQSIK